MVFECAFRRGMGLGCPGRRKGGGPIRGFVITLLAVGLWLVVIAAVAWMWYSAPDNNRSIQRFRQARRSLAKGGRRNRGDPASPSTAGQSSVVVMSTQRRSRSGRVVDLRGADGGPARWPADGWSLGSEATGSGRLAWGADVATDFENDFENDSESALRRQPAGIRNSENPPAPAPERPMTAWEIHVAAREAREARQAAAMKAAEEAAYAAIREARQAPGPRPAPLTPPPHSRPAAIRRPAETPPRSSTPRRSVPAQSQPPRAHPAAPRPAAPRPERRMADIPHHAAIAQRDAFRQPAGDAQRGSWAPDGDGAPRWSVIDLNDSPAASRSQPARSQPARSAALRGDSVRVQARSASPAPLPESWPARPKAARTAPSPEALKLDPLEYLDRASVKPGQGVPQQLSSSASLPGPTRRRPVHDATQDGLAPRYRQVGGVTYVAVDRFGEPETARRAKQA
jgi:hypothetical protein